MFWWRLLSCSALIVLLLAPMGAQTPEDQSAIAGREKQQKELELKKELEKKTFALLDEVITGASVLKLPENRLIIQASAADLLWQRDEKRARALFKSALDNLLETARLLTGKSSPEKMREYSVLQQQRRELLL